MKKLLLSIAFGFSLMAKAQEGILDATFATAGVFKTDDNRSTSKSAIQADGKILICGSRYDANGTDFGVFRHNTDGSMDATFGTNGAVVIDFFTKTDVANGIAVVDGGKILVAGTVIEGAIQKYGLVRLNSNGTLDNTFGTNGKIVTNVPGATALGLKTMEVASNGNFILGGTADGFSKAALVAYKNTGELDLSFDTDGILQPSTMVEVQSIKYQADGKILISGGSNIARLNANGSTDNTFGTNGVYRDNTFLLGAKNMYIDLTPNGKILSIFSTGIYPEVNLVRLTNTGKLDSAFGTNGKTTFKAAMGANQSATAIKVQANGKALVIGSTPSDLFIARLNENGTLDATFGTNGATVTSVRTGGGEDNARAFSIQANGKIIVAGDQCGGMCTYFLLRYTANLVGNPSGLATEKGKFITAIYPNPANETIQVTVAQNINIQSVSILDLNGKKIKEVDHSFSIPVTDLPEGIYLIQVMSEAGIATQKFIKQ